MRFWDSSALVPLLAEEATTDAMRRRLREDRDVLVWWGARVECVSALTRCVREGRVVRKELVRAEQRLLHLTQAWLEVAPTEPVRAAAQRLLRVHPLRAADALQLAAAVVAAEQEAASLELVTLDDRLAEAAEREGFRVLGT